MRNFVYRNWVIFHKEMKEEQGELAVAEIPGNQLMVHK